jgi:Family of unknown function (DUF6599)
VLRVCAVLIVAAGVAAAAAPQPSCAIVPGWTQAGPARTYTVDNLYEYMDGNSEGYFLYNFQEMRGVTCKQGEITFVLDISDMGDADFAYGMFSSTRDLREPAYPVGAGGQIVPRRLIFAKGQYYVEIAANPEGNHTAALKLFAAALDKSVPGSTTPPAALAWFPKERQVSLRLIPESVLGLRILKAGYMGQYEFGKAWVVSDPAAADVMQKLKARFNDVAPSKIADDSFTATDKYLGRLCIFRKGNYVAGYAITDSTDPAPLAAQLAAKLPSPTH